MVKELMEKEDSPEKKTELVDKCSSCKSIHNPETDKWVRPGEDHYTMLQTQYEKHFSHGLCDVCLEAEIMKAREYKSGEIPSV